jgi:hypothetical protein
LYDNLSSPGDWKKWRSAINAAMQGCLDKWEIGLVKKRHIPSGAL